MMVAVRVVLVVQIVRELVEYGSNGTDILRVLMSTLLSITICVVLIKALLELQDCHYTIVVGIDGCEHMISCFVIRFENRRPIAGADG